jgi:predicted nuclease of predicted toxin-antitoxin system
MKLLIDMNFSPYLVDIFIEEGWQALHWSAVGDPRADDSIIMKWARDNGYVIFTHDLDFGTLLAVTHAQGPSVIQVRTQDILSQSFYTKLIQILRKYEAALEKGALIVVDENRSRVRILPLNIS